MGVEYEYIAVGTHLHLLVYVSVGLFLVILPTVMPYISITCCNNNFLLHVTWMYQFTLHLAKAYIRGTASEPAYSEDFRLVHVNDTVRKAIWF